MLYFFYMKNEKSLRLLSVDQVIELAQKQGVDFGKGKPYNRLRYYTKLGWLPNMQRKGKNGEGHYPHWVINRLKLIQKLKDKGYSNEIIAETIEKREKIRSLFAPLLTSRFQRKLLLGGISLLLGLIILSELDIIPIGKSKKEPLPLIQPETSVFP
ncbi:MerR family transcriptional regulator [candidate division WWE3 bacterium]|nr:MerR family transcriptional regulator [candidate division WWE3 bacterium]